MQTTTSTTKEAYKEKMEAQLKQWSVRLEALRAKADKAAASLKVDLLAKAEELKHLEVSAKKQIIEVELAVSDSWQQVKGDIEQTWDQLSGSVEAIWEKLTKESQN